ncbi:trap transporter solute receptor dctp/teaa [Lucifera butyrica]|uniref:Trap transporter solute receptor dctp/teaa n=1 Tax=Lucifera butyrica TaxID=1351585 RepID=A0A498R8B9_9FIRM|nr:TRAP transporter substrate-binding protein [Lucifera butyrica]VBB05388.1 trap transporter solute receptor dctp/teaa [Lucifera butyrica]
MKKQKWIILGAAALFAMVSLVAGCGGSTAKAPAQKEIVLKAADVQPEGYPTVEGLKYMAKLLDERSHGRIKMQVYAGGQLGGEKETIEMTQMGTVAIARVNSAPMVSFAPKMGVYSMPFIFRNEDHLWKVLDGPVGKELLKDLTSANLIGLGYYDSGARSFYTKSKPINTPEDAKGLKIRVQQSKIFIDTMNALGASATPMDYGEVYSGLQTGIIDGAENNPPSLYSSKHYEVAKYYSLDEHSMVPEVILMSKKVWDGLSPDDQKLIAQAAFESEAYERKAWNEYTEKSLEQLKAHGVKISKPDKEPFIKAMAPVYAQYPEYKDLISQIQAVK